MCLWYWSVGFIQFMCGIPSLRDPRLIFVLGFCTDVTRTWLFVIAANVSLNVTLCVAIPLTYFWQIWSQTVSSSQTLVGWDLPWINTAKANMTDQERIDLFWDWKWTIYDPRLTYANDQAVRNLNAL